MIRTAKDRCFVEEYKREQEKKRREQAESVRQLLKDQDTWPDGGHIPAVPRYRE